MEINDVILRRICLILAFACIGLLYVVSLYLVPAPLTTRISDGDLYVKIDGIVLSVSQSEKVATLVVAYECTAPVTVFLDKPLTLTKNQSVVIEGKVTEGKVIANVIGLN